MITRLLTMACCCLLAAAAPLPENSRRDLELLQGTWEHVSIEAEGEKVPPEDYRGAVAVIEKAQIAMGKDDQKETATITLDATKNPKWIETTTPKGERLLGIYKLDGDRLTICLSKKKGDRPKAFAAPKGTEHGLLTLKRKKP